MERESAGDWFVKLIEAMLEKGDPNK